MNVTEMLITGFDGEQAVFAVNLSSDVATAVSTNAEEARQQATDAFEAIWEILERLARVEISVS